MAPMKWRYEKDNYVPKLCIRELNNFNSGAPNGGATLPAKTMNGRSKNVIKLSSRGGHAENEFVLSITANLAATSVVYLLSEQDVISEQGGAKISFST